METSRRIRVGTRNYVIRTRIAAVSQEHVLVCITRKVTARKCHGFSGGIEIDLFVVWVVEIDVISVWGIGVDLLSV